MSALGEPATGWAYKEFWGITRLAWAIFGVVLAVALVVVVVAWVQDQRADDRRADTYYCTLSGVGPFDRAPNTGERCIDVLDD